MSKVQVTNNTERFISDTGMKLNAGMRFIGELAVEKAEPLTPRRKGDLRRNVKVRMDTTRPRVTLTWTKEYAAAQEVGTVRGRPIKKYNTAGTGKGYARKGVQQAIKQAPSIMKRVMGN